MSEVKQINTFEEFYPYYLSQHRHPFNRKVRITGITLSLACIVNAIWLMHLGYLMISPIFYFVSMLFGHYIVEKNTPLLFKYPLWTLKADSLIAYRSKFDDEFNVKELEKYNITSLENDWFVRKSDKIDNAEKDD